MAFSSRIKLIGPAFAVFWALSAHAVTEPPILRAALESEPTTLDWNHARSQVDRFLVSFLMRGLFKFDESGKPVCDLCKSFTVSTDGREYRFELDAAAKWSDGTPLEAAHFVDGLKRGMSGETRARAEGPHRLVVSLPRPHSILPNLLAQPAAFPIRREYAGNAETMASQATLGPYLLAAWERGKRIVIEGNPNYEGVRPVYRVDFSFGSHAEQFKRFKAAQIDLLPNPTTEELLSLAAASGESVQVNPYWATRLLIFNTKHGPGVNAAFRRAILFALDRSQLPVCLKNGERAATGLIPPGISGHRELPLATRDLARALAERTRFVTGSKAITLSVRARDTETNRNVMRWLADELAAVKIDLHPRFADSGEADAFLATRVFHSASALDLLSSFASSAPDNLGRWTNVGYDSIVEKLLRTEAGPASAPLLDLATQTLETQEVAAIPLGFPTQPFLVGRRVVSFAMTPFGDPDLVKIQLKK